MTQMLDDAATDPWQIIADLQGKLAEAHAERDEAQEREKATAEVLGVITSSPSDLAPVFDAILEKAMNLCGAAFGALMSYDGERVSAVATRGLPPQLVDVFRQPVAPRRDGDAPYARFLRGESLLHIIDMAADDVLPSLASRPRALVEIGGARTGLEIPLRQEGAVLGSIWLYRQEVRPFTDKQIALLQNFAAQAVIAMENARLITETREALEQQTATAEVLQVINTSPGDLGPVFDVMLEKAIRLCEAAFGILWTYDGELFHAVAFRDVPPGYAEFLREPHHAGPLTGLGRVASGEAFAHIIDMLADEGYRTGDPVRRAGIELAGARTHLSMPLRKDDVLLGNFAVFRTEVRPFTDKQIALVQNFAAQAVIAMENARLITETREALEQQTATAEVLQVINSSPGDLAPVFDAMLEKAMRLCEAAFGLLWIYDGERFHVAATNAVPEAFAKFLRDNPQAAPRKSDLGRLLQGEPIIHRTDYADEVADDRGSALRRAFLDLGGGRTGLIVALRKENAVLGALRLYRQEVRPFSDKQIALLQNFAAQAVIAMENARLITETREALQQQTATAEVLQVINASPGDLAPVFETMLERAMRLCGAAFGGLWTFDGDRYVATTLRDVPDAYAEFLAANTMIPGPGSAPYRFLHGERSVIQNIDLAAEENYHRGDPQRLALVDLGGARTALQVPLCLKDRVLGVITLYRQEVRPFTDRQVALLQNFAAQAVIAIENARLITETQEALEQQTATAEVLGVINSSPGNLTPVFDAMLEKAMRLCEAPAGFLLRYEDGRYAFAVGRGLAPKFAKYLSRMDQPAPNEANTRVAEGVSFVHVADLKGDDAYRSGAAFRRAIVDLGGFRTGITVSLCKDGELLGSFNLGRYEVRPFSEKQVTLLQNFAAQAVIAMENARLLTETREALEQQTATAEVLQVINSSPGHLAPVFDSILEKAHSLCGAAYGSLHIADDDAFRGVAMRGIPEAFAAILRQRNYPGPNHPVRQLIAGAPYAMLADGAERDDPLIQNAVKLAGMRTALWVPLRKDDALLGYIVASRKEPRPFSDKQIALLENFAAQAVIAMENARLITETREALEQQTATAEVLQVINSSPGDLTPVFDAILEKAHVLCGAPLGSLVVREGEHLRSVATRGYPQEYDQLARRGFSLGTSTTIDRLLNPAERWVQADDVAADIPDNESSVRRAAREIAGFRTALWVPLRKDGYLLGYISAQRQEVRPFTGKQIGLLENFAAQAVIAMENARLITETQEALDQQTATAEVLGVINSSPGDLAPVFNAMLDRAMRLCEAAFSIMSIYDGERFHRVALHNVPAAYAEFMEHDPPQPSPQSALGRIRAGERIVHIEDYAREQADGSDDPRRRALAELGGARSYVAVGLYKDHKLLGTLAAYRQEVRPFSNKQIALLENFAAQAVIAIENARLITETREALEQQTATAEVLQVINSSPGDLGPVFDAMVEKAMRLCEAAFGHLDTYDGNSFHTSAIRGVPAAYAEYRRSNPPNYGPGTGPARMLAGERIVHHLDMMDEEAYRRGEQNRRALVDLGGARSAINVALVKDRTFLGFITLFRQEVRPFSDKQIALLENFAAQAVIAIENARLITETREALEQQTATAEVLQVINSSPGDLSPVFEAMLEKAMHLCGAVFGELRTYDGDRFQLVATRGTPAAYAEYYARQDTGRYGPGTGPARLLEGEPVVHIPDLIATEPYQRGDPDRRALVDLGGARAYVLVPLLADRRVRGYILIYRREPGPFSEKQIALLQNFAAQAVIAMENARLLDEIRQRQAELRVTFDNMADGVVMFDEELRLAAWNRNFQELLDLPDAVLTERPSYADYLRILAERGEFGTDDIEAELSRRLEETDRELRLERTRPDGRVIEVRRNAVPGGGFVLIYSDITERKRSEAEIRAARDAAEATLRDLRAAQANLIQAEKMASLGQLTAGIAHEIKNPLNFVNNFADLSGELLKELKESAAPGWAALDEDKRAEIDETMEMLTGNLEKIGEHGRRADGIVKSMLEHSRGVTSERRVVDLNNLIEEALNLAYHGARAQDQTFNIRMDRDFDRDLARIELVPQEMSRVFINLFGNGFYAATKRQRDSAETGFHPTLTVATRDLGEAVEVRVRDNGIGIPAEIKDKLFQPFFTTKPTGEGTGLGLSISYDIVTQQHGGNIEVDSRVGEFTEFTIRLPRNSQATSTAAS